ncbi:hypothetical protein B0O99DRAFT_678867 [Bisporella sp. PMI_857]|nr:hypothetical protein B0O99DRAFT_678867 [Bisporella sp. PMI_857]
MIPPASSGVLLALIYTVTRVLAQNITDPSPQLPTFGQPVAVPGAMERFDQDFADGLAIDLFSPKNRTLVVNQNTNPLGAQFVTASNGEPFIGLQAYSYIIQMNETADDLIAKIEIPYDPVMLNSVGVQESNTYVGRLSEDKMSWVIDDFTRNVHRSENNTRIIKMTSITGEFRLFGRQTLDTSNIFVQYGQGATRTVNITAGGRQEAEFIDGLRLSVVASKNITMNADIRNGIPQGTLSSGIMAVNSFAWVVNSSDPTSALYASMRFPVNRNIVQALSPAGGETKLAIVNRQLNSPPTTPFTMAGSAAELEEVERGGNGRIRIDNLQQLDGEYLLVLALMDKGIASSRT